MSDAECVVRAFSSFREARDSTVRAQFPHPGTTPCEYFVRVGLVTDIPDESIARRIENVVQSDRQFDGAEIG